MTQRTAHRGVEQLAAREAHNLQVAGSSPAPANMSPTSRTTSPGRAAVNGRGAASPPARRPARLTQPGQEYIAIKTLAVMLSYSTDHVATLLARWEVEDESFRHFGQGKAKRWRLDKVRAKLLAEEHAE